MEAIKIICYSLFAFGACNVVIYGEGPFKILENFRKLISRLSGNLSKLFSCIMCLSVNLGVALSLIDCLLLDNIELTPFNIIFNDPTLWWLIMLLDGGITSGTSWLLYRIDEYLGQ